MSPLSTREAILGIATDKGCGMQKFYKSNVREFLSTEKNSLRRSSDASLSSLRFSFLPNALELVSVSSRAMTTTGTVVAVLAVLGLKTRVLMSSKDFGAEGEAIMASRQVAGEDVSACVMVAEGVMDRPARDWVIESIVFDDVEEKARW